ncbi:UDPglucose glycoprotein glucose phosphotransferase [Scheffersomyces xylosifermentans]|uniref:UDPglucose glycoprotein glucose phosphotransferase n=1 Tax=Scheffersomyces xylosifermentans TaxID=1304137 RepID=UPI00315CF176
MVFGVRDVLCVLLITCFSLGKEISSGKDGNQLKIELHAPWIETSFELNLLESIAAQNESLYVRVASKLAGIVNNDEDDEEEDDSGEDFQSLIQKQKYETTLKSLNLDPTSESFINFNFVNKIYTPRVQAHYDYYSTIIEPKFAERLKIECAKDSFGNKIASAGKGLETWLLYNDKIYCSSDELYALQTDSKSDVELFPFDRVIGENEKAPLLVLYSSQNSKHFSDFFQNLYESAKSGKLRFVWRYVPPQDKTICETLPGYGVDLSLKRTDYVVIDDRDVSSTSSSKGSKKSKKPRLNLRKQLQQISELEELYPLSKESLELLGLKLTSFIQANDYKHIPKYELLLSILQDFPKYASFIADLPRDRDEDLVREVVHANEDIGLSKDSYGLYVNGSPIHKLELDLFKLLNKIQEELNTIERLQDLGFSVEQAKFMIVKFALLSAVKQTQFRNGNTIMGKNENRFKVYNYAYSARKRRGVVFLNDIEKDVTYEQYSSDRKEVYLGPDSFRLKPNQIPPLRENVHDLVFALNFANRAQLKVLFTLSKIILDSGIPQQVGIIPVLGDDPLDLTLAEKFYHIIDTSNPQEALAFLYKYLESPSSDDTQALVDSVKSPKDSFDPEIFQSTLKRFSIDQASVIFNGVIYDLTSPNWQIAMGKQLSQDISLLKQYIRSGAAEGKSLKSLLYENAASERNLRIIPIEPSEILYKPIDRDLIENSILFKKSDSSDILFGTFWLIGDFSRISMRIQLRELLQKVKKSKHEFQVRLINTGPRVKILDTLSSKFNLSKLSHSQIDSVVELIPNTDEALSNELPNEKIFNLLESKHLPIHHDFMLFNSRYFRLDSTLGSKDLDLLLEYEFTQRMSIFSDIVDAYPVIFDDKRLVEFYSANESVGLQDWFDLFSSVVTKSFHFDDKFYIADVARFDFSKLDLGNSFDVSPSMESKKVDILLIVDPVDEYSQKTISIVNSFKEFPFVNIKVLLQPRIESMEDLKIKRFYKGAFPASIPQFNEQGKWISNHSVLFQHLPSSEILTSELDIPSRWITTIKVSPIGVDLDNIRFDNYEEKSVCGTYDLKNIIVEGYARNIKNGNVPAGVALTLEKEDRDTDTNIMATLGYFQLHASPGVWYLSIKEGKSSEHYSLLSATENRFVVNDTPIEYAQVALLSLQGNVIYPRLKKNEGFENVDFAKASTGHSKPDDVKGGLMQSVLKIGKKDGKKQADINVFTIASGHLYERFLSIMTASLRKNSKGSIKIWVIENYVSSHFKRLLPFLSEKYDVEFELITYKWPNFLRKQREKQRSIWGYKILFLDVLFPQDLDKVIFVDADQIVRTDLKELVDLDLEGAPYGFTPMCDTRKEMEGFRFWKEGYWTQVLKDDLKYHISALYVVDLIKFRQISAGDRLRSHYQKLSADPNSLANLDQDLPNNMQRSIKIFSLPQEWLWCETWCSDETMKKAKTIDLCNNPLTKENKLDRARRLIPEWVEYDVEIQELVRLSNEKLAEDQKQQELEEKRKQEAELQSSDDEFHSFDDDEEDNEFEHDEL